MKRLLTFGCLCAPLVIWGWLLVAPRSTQAQEAPMFVPGQRLMVVWDCLPQILGEMVSQAVGGQSVNPCYAEQLEVVVVWKNGWLTVRDEQGAQWVVNASRAIGYKVITTRQAGR